MTRKPKVKRVVLGVGHPWFSVERAGNFMLAPYTAIKLLPEDGHGKPIPLKMGVGGYDRIRLVAEILPPRREVKK